MKPLSPLFFLLFVLIFSIAAPAVFSQEKKPNVLLICIDDLRPELGCYGVDYIQSPNIDAIAAKGRIFKRHYVQAPTCGASRYTLLTGTYGPADNGALFKRAKSEKKDPSLPAFFRDNGYTTVSVGKVSHHPGGRGGSDWDDDTILEMPDSWDRHLLPAGPWQHPRGSMHGLANGEIRKNAKDMDLFQATEGPDSIYPDGPIIDESLDQLESLAADDKPFFLAVGIIRPHLPFGAPAKYLEPYKDATLPPIAHPEKPSGTTTWHGSGEFMKYNRWGKNPNTDAEFALEVRKHYAACVTYADAQVGRVIEKLDALKLRDDTIIIVWGDHGWHLGEHAIWGKHALFEESLHSPLVISYKGIPESGKSANAIVETVDLFPTLCDLADFKKPGYLDGKSLAPILKDPTAKSDGIALAYRNDKQTIRTDQHRLILHKKGAVELYDHTSGPSPETRNLAKNEPELVEKLTAELKKAFEAR